MTLPGGRAVARFLALTTLLAAVLLAPWPLVRGPYRSALVAFSGAAFGHAGADRRVAFVAVPPRESGRDVLVRPGLAGGGESRTVFGLSSLRHGYLPSALFVACVLATPLGRRRRALALLGGLVALQLFYLARLGTALVFAFSTVRRPDGRLVLALGEDLRSGLYRATSLVWEEPHTGFVGVLAVWAVACFWGPAAER